MTEILDISKQCELTALKKQLCPEQHQKQHVPHAEGGDFLPLPSLCETPHGVLHPALGSSEQQRWAPVGRAINTSRGLSSVKTG